MAERYIKRFFRPLLTGEVQVDFGELITSVLLLPQIVVDSARFKEFIDIVKAFGFEGTMDLLTSGILRLNFHPSSAGSLHIRSAPRGGVHLMRLVSINAAKRDEMITKSLAVLDQLAPECLNGAQLDELKKAISDILITPNPTRGSESLKETYRILLNDPEYVTTIVSAVASKALPFQNFAELTVNLARAEGDDLFIRTNLGRIGGFDPKKEFELVQKSLLGVAGMGHSLEVMRELDAIEGFRDDELVFMEQRLRHLYRLAGKDTGVLAFRRIVTVVDCPDVETSARSNGISIKALLKVRESPELAQFRTRLNDLSKMSDEEIREFFGSFQEKVAGLYSGTLGKLARLLVPTAADLALPGSGTALGAVDTFLLDKFIKRDPSVVFVKDIYPSIFRFDK